MTEAISFMIGQWISLVTDGRFLGVCDLFANQVARRSVRLCLWVCACLACLACLLLVSLAWLACLLACLPVCLLACFLFVFACWLACVLACLLLRVCVCVSPTLLLPVALWLKQLSQLVVEFVMTLLFVCVRSFVRASVGSSVFVCLSVLSSLLH